MNTFSKVLLATDLSQQAANLTKCLCSLCPERETEVVLAHVLSDDDDADPHGTDFQKVSAHLAQCQEELLQAGFGKVSTITPVGSEPDQILNMAADQLEADLLMVAAHEKNFFQRALLGSTSRDLAEICTVPLFINDDDGDDRDDLLAKILLPTDFSRKSLECLNIVKDLREHVGKLYFMHVVERSRSKDEFKEQQAAARLFLQELVDEMKLFGIEADYVVAKGVASKQIAKFCQQEHVNLIVMSKTGAGMSSDQGIGSTSHNVVETAACAVLLLPAEDDGD